MTKHLCENLRAAGGAALVAWAAAWGLAACASVAAEGDAAIETAAEPTAEPEVAAETEAAVAAEVAEAEQVEVAGLDWYVDYYAAYRAAADEERFLLINVLPAETSAAQQGAEQTIAADANLRDQLSKVVRLRVPMDATITVEGETKPLLSFASFAELNRGPGWLLIDLRNKDQEYYGYTVSVLPYASGKYYHWRPDYLSVTLSVPAGTLTQRTMIWAVRIHPEAPQSTWGYQHPALINGATHQASYQADVGQQGHQNFETRFHSLSAAAGSSVSEVCAESWPNQNMIDSCLDCVDSWRHSSGHWRGVSGRHRAFGYDIRRGRNGIWYGTGIFAD